MRLTGKDRETNEEALERAHRAGRGDTSRTAQAYVAELDELAGLGVGWARDLLERFTRNGAGEACRRYRRRSFIKGSTMKGDALRVSAYSGAKRLENLTLAEAIAHAARLEAQARTMHAEAKQVRRWVEAAESVDAPTLGAALSGEAA